MGMGLEGDEQRVYDILEYKWEFLRRNPHYIEKWNEALALRKKHK